MRTKLLFFGFSLVLTNVFCQVGIGTITPSRASMLEISSSSDLGATFKGIMPPRVPHIMARDAINAGYADYGLIVFVTDNGNDQGCLQIWDGENWNDIKCIDLASPIAWINEFHYDNIGIDVGEFIEIAGPAGLNLNTYKLELYSGANGRVYNDRTLSGIIPNQSNGIGTVSFSYPTNGIQNGPNDGIALIDSGKVLYFISYQGTLTATNGTAAGMVSVDIGVKESGTTPIKYSLQLKGSGRQYKDFTWTAPTPESPGTINDGQIID